MSRIEFYLSEEEADAIEAANLDIDSLRSDRLSNVTVERDSQPPRLALECIADDPAPYVEEASVIANSILATASLMTGKPMRSAQADATVKNDGSRHVRLQLSGAVMGVTSMSGTLTVYDSKGNLVLPPKNPVSSDVASHPAMSLYQDSLTLGDKPLEQFNVLWQAVLLFASRELPPATKGGVEPSVEAVDRWLCEQDVGVDQDQEHPLKPHKKESKYAAARHSMGHPGDRNLDLDYLKRGINPSLKTIVATLIKRDVGLH